MHPLNIYIKRRDEAIYTRLREDAEAAGRSIADYLTAILRAHYGELEDPLAAKLAGETKKGGGR
jgi:hypothetical protein